MGAQIECDMPQLTRNVVLLSRDLPRLVSLLGAWCCHYCLSNALRRTVQNWALPACYNYKVCAQYFSRWPVSRAWEECEKEWSSASFDGGP